MSPREVCLGVVDGEQEDQKLELRCRETETGTVEVELRLLAWGEGIGWYSQRSLPLPADLAGLRVLLRRAERHTRARGSERQAGARIVAFPRVQDVAAR